MKNIPEFYQEMMEDVQRNKDNPEHLIKMLILKAVPMGLTEFTARETSSYLKEFNAEDHEKMIELIYEQVKPAQESVVDGLKRVLIEAENDSVSLSADKLTKMTIDIVKHHVDIILKKAKEEGVIPTTTH